MKSFQFDRGMAWHGNAGRGMAWRGMAWQGKSRKNAYGGRNEFEQQSMACRGGARHGGARPGKTSLVAAWHNSARQGRTKNMVIASAVLESISPYSQSQGFKSPRGTKEPFDKHEARCWRERMNTDSKGMVIIPAMAFKNCLTSIAQYLGETVPGKKGATYTKHFKAGVIVAEPVQLGIDSKTVEPETLFVPSDGKAGGGSRVWKTFPLIPKWSGKLIVHILDETISEDLFKKYLQQAGNFVGVGRFRPQSNGFYGRFKVNKINFEVLED